MPLARRWRDKDYVGNVRIYAEAGVPEYVAVEPGDVDRSPWLVVEDAATGERLRFSDEEEAARREAERRAENAERRADELEREIARLRGRLGQDS